MLKKLIALALVAAGGVAYFASSKKAGGGAMPTKPNTGGGMIDAAQEFGEAVADKVGEYFPSFSNWELPSLDANYSLSGKPVTYATSTPAPTVRSDNVRAFLDVIAKAEGTYGYGDNGYNILFGHKTFNGYAWHPRIAKQFEDKAGRRLWTTAAGRYQFMCASPLPNGGSTRVDTWTRIAKKIGLKDFSPASQDLAAIELIKERGAYQAVIDGRLGDAIYACRNEWASLPNNDYQQGSRSLAFLQTAFKDAGGVLA